MPVPALTAGRRALQVHILGEWDWWQTPDGFRLHAAVVVEYNADFDPCGYGATLCRPRRRTWLSIPGLLSRMSSPRCSHCCRILGYPHGSGSPKNDRRCRPSVVARLRQLGLRPFPRNLRLPQRPLPR